MVLMYCALFYNNRTCQWSLNEILVTCSFLEWYVVVFKVHCIEAKGYLRLVLPVQRILDNQHPVSEEGYRENNLHVDHSKAIFVVFEMIEHDAHRIAIKFNFSYPLTNPSFHGRVPTIGLAMLLGHLR